MSQLFFVEVQADSTLTGDVQEKLSTAFRTIMKLREYRVEVEDFRFDAMPKGDSSSFGDYLLQIHYSGDKGLQGDYFEVSSLLFALLKWPGNRHGVIVDYWIFTSTDLEDRQSTESLDSCPFESLERVLDRMNHARQDVAI
ncbi:hypothetical protein DET61_11631 [Marinobacter nauticus]|jgi:hypothetical protein|uniref:Uncharacterized protein n=1 Tax=Marinobacter nauticus TaxID=2743 RepID=A0A368X7L7_MARNT|nr:hypothetical protein [Marinobacter nauticus]RCW63990.1 hypothetical protein DET61_11631 [Marinobacter nauticus]|tara:strand:+ start:870 stop:1292 length:423 start_codon:yes stop_codon:yes gene_type:complete